MSSDHNEIKLEINNVTSKVMYGSKGKSQVKKKLIEKNKNIGLSWDLLAVQWLSIHASTAGDMGSIPS